MEVKMDRKVSLSQWKAQLREAEKRKEAYDKQKEILDEKNRLAAEKKAAEALYLLQNTKLVPP